MEDQTKIAPIHDQILVKQDPPKEKIGMLYVPQGEEEYPPIATVLKVGPGKYDATGQRLPLDVKPGDRVLFKRRGMTALIPDSREGGREEWKDVLVLREDDILGVVEEE